MNAAGCSDIGDTCDAETAARASVVSSRRKNIVGAIFGQLSFWGLCEKTTPGLAAGGAAGRQFKTAATVYT